MKILLEFIFNIREVFNIYLAHRIEQLDQDLRYRKMLDLGFIERPDWFLDNPAKYPGAAMLYAQKYGLVLGTGIARSQIKAALPERLWRRHPHEVGYGWVDRNNLCAAVCDCLIMCKKDGLL